MKLTVSMENYLEAIYELTEGKSGARVSDIARKLGVTKASTNSAMTTLSDKGLIENEKYGEIFLTPAGLNLARFTAQKHQIIREFLTRALGIDPAVADADACAIEHVISLESVAAMKQLLPDDDQRGDSETGV
ncbi:MAG: metal-dependent transcriptional regulator [Christensenellales bacterium]|jgi:Mn-dependent DtxR family transcriptional regulator